VQAVTFTKGNKHGHVYAGKKPSLSKLEEKLDKLFSRYIRLSDADEGGTVQCVTCQKLMHWKESQCGHWVKRQHRAVRWDERNVGVQCPRCNHFMGGCQDEFGLHIITKYGESVFQELMQLKHKVMKHTRSDLEALIDLYKAKLAPIERD
jgi:uncharacterized CHY-type Zn-finger protein